MIYLQHVLLNTISVKNLEKYILAGDEFIFHDGNKIYHTITYNRYNRKLIINGSDGEKISYDKECDSLAFYAKRKKNACISKIIYKEVNISKNILKEDLLFQKSLLTDVPYDNESYYKLIEYYTIIEIFIFKKLKGGSI